VPPTALSAESKELTLPNEPCPAATFPLLACDDEAAAVSGAAAVAALPPFAAEDSVKTSEEATAEASGPSSSLSICDAPTSLLPGSTPSASSSVLPSLPPASSSPNNVDGGSGGGAASSGGLLLPATVEGVPPVRILGGHMSPQCLKLLESCLASLVARQQAVWFLDPVDPDALGIPQYRTVVSQSCRVVGS